MQWWQVYVQVPEWSSEEVGVYLQHLGSPAIVVHDDTVLSPQQASCLDTGSPAPGGVVLQGAFQEDIAFLSRLTALQRFLGTSSQTTPGIPWKLYCCRLYDQGYATQWQHFFRPLWVGDRLVIRPSWDTSPLPPQAVCLTLDPGLAFGTGTHPTTRMCLALINQYADSYQEEPCLDVGCGSGILSLAAVQLGLRTVVGVDIDPQAIAVATQNALLNALHEHVRFLQGSWEVVRGMVFAMIVANIYLGPLVEMMHPIVRCLAAHGTLILSGIVEHQEATLHLALQKAGLCMVSRFAEEGWVALAAQRLPSAHELRVPAS